MSHPTRAALSRHFCFIWLLSSAALANGQSPWVVLPESLGTEVMKQCSRDTPQHIQHFWVPTTADILLLEKRLRRYEVSNNAESRLQLTKSHRQYIGFIKGNKRYIYTVISIRP
jgi:hypothetical protein